MRALLFISQNYSFEILRPIQSVALSRGYSLLWFADKNNVDLSRFHADEEFTTSLNQVKRFNPNAVFAPGNYVPSFIPGLKVQVFHGLEWKKKGHFRIRDYFDLYCTHGPITTNRFKELAEQHQNFLVRETGWSKLDPLFNSPAINSTNAVPTIIYAPTFSEDLTSAADCFAEIKRLAEQRDWKWIVKFHPLMAEKWVKKYQSLESDNLKVMGGYSILPLLKEADVLLSDTSSVIGEFLLLNKPVVAFNNSQPEPAIINVLDPEQIEKSLEAAINPSEKYLSLISEHNLQLHPYTDGCASKRILDSAEEIIESGSYPAKRRPLNTFRNLKIRAKLGYWNIRK